MLTFVPLFYFSYSHCYKTLKYLSVQFSLVHGMVLNMVTVVVFITGARG